MKPFRIASMPLMLGLLLTGCATVPPVATDVTTIVPPADTVPSTIREAPPADLQLAQVSDRVDAHRGAPVRWGGIIDAVEESQEGTQIKILERPLDGYGKPERQRPSAGRFVAQMDEFLDPEDYAQGREITVAGYLEGEGEWRSSKLPLVQAREHFLWDDDYAYHPHHYHHHPRFYPRRHYRFSPHRHYGLYPRYHLGFHFGYGRFRGHPFRHHGFRFGHGFYYPYGFHHPFYW